MKHLCRYVLLACLLGAVIPPRLRAQGTAFTYQGHLSASGAPATGVYDMRFVLRDALTGGNQVPGTPVPAGLVAVSNGQFTATLDFGAAAFSGAARWLEIGVRTNGSAAAHTTLAPRQPLTATPYATMASSAASYSGAVSDSQLSANVARLSGPQTFSGLTTFGPSIGVPFAVSNTNRVTNLHADLLDGFSANAFWNIGGNLGTGASNFVGTLDNQPLQFRVNNARALRLEPNATSPNVIGGHPGNNVAAGVAGATIGGGGASGATNEVTALHGTVSGGRANRVTGNFGTVGGGSGNWALGDNAFVGAGNTNRALGASSTIGGGQNNLATNAHSAVAGGGWNTASGVSSFIGGGGGNTFGGPWTNTASGDWSAILGGWYNTASGYSSVVGGGSQNTASGRYAVIPGGNGNQALGNYSFAAGLSAIAAHAGSFVWSDSSFGSSFSSTGPNQFLIRAAGGVGIGGPPEDAALDVEGDLRINGHDIFLRSGSNRDHGLGWYGSGKTFAGVNVDGPVAYGWSGGALGTVQGGDRLALQWNAVGNVGIGTAPSVKFHVADTAQTVGVFDSSSPVGTGLGLGNTSAGGKRWSLISSGVNNVDGAGQLLFSVDSSSKVIFRGNGNVGIGTVVPGERLELYGFDTTLRIRNQNDAAGGFIGNTYGALQLGLYNPSTNAFGVVPAGVKRSFFGFDFSGKVGSLVNNYFNPSFRNLLDDGSGNMSVNPNGTLNFGATTRQMINLWNANYGVGVQNNTLYFRTDGNVAWYRGGAHADGADDSGGGTTLMRLDGGGLTVNGTFVSASDRARKENFAEVRPRDVLERLASMPIQRWNYKDDAKVRHIGPMAQDFHAAFGVGPDEKHIAMVDADGVALAAIQGLNEVVKEKEAAIEALQRENQSLEKRLEALEKMVAALAAQLPPGK